MDRAVKYKEKPTKEQVVTDLNRFLAQSPQFKGKLKIGKATLESITNFAHARYSVTSKFEYLTFGHIFAICYNERLALDVEKMARECAMNKNLLIDMRDRSDGALNGNKSFTYIVYVTQLKKDLFTCPLKSCKKVMTKVGIEAHRFDHTLIQKTIRANELLKMMKKEPMKITVEPIPWFPEDRADKKCPFCQKEFKTYPNKQQHMQFNCSMNPEKRSKIKCEICGKELQKNSMSAHKRGHILVKCEVCGKEFKQTYIKKHFKIHNKIK